MSFNYLTKTSSSYYFRMRVPQGGPKSTSKPLSSREPDLLYNAMRTFRPHQAPIYGH